MNRRSFIKTGSLAGISLSAIPLTVKAFSSQSQQDDFLLHDDFILNEISINELQQQMTSGVLTSRSLVQLYLDRIKNIDKSGPKLNSVIEINPDALEIAEAMDNERKAGKIRGKLHGIPVLVKDNIDTADKMQTTAGSLALEGHYAGKDAFVIKKLREAGAVIIGKTNLSEWANFRSEKSTSGWSSRGGLTKNPYVLNHNTSGSSSGSGASVAANLCTVAVGTETDGSVVCPSSANGIAGLKPTVGLISRSGIIPISHSQDTAGPMARTVADLAILLGEMTGIDPNDNVTIQSEGKYHPDYTKFLNSYSFKGNRIGIVKKWRSSDDRVNQLFDEASKVMVNLGAELVEIDISDEINTLSKDEYELMKFEFKHGLNKYLSQSGAGIKSLKEVIEFNQKHMDKAMPFFRQDILESSEQKGGLDSGEYLNISEKIQTQSRHIINKTLKDNNLLAITGLTMSPACASDLVYGDKSGDIYAGTLSAISGYPHITVPCGTVYQLPVGLSFFAGAYSEPILLGLAYAYEQATKKRVSPKFRKSLTEVED
ncbi:MAG: amidase [Bacteroidales bacterium]